MFFGNKKARADSLYFGSKKINAMYWGNEAILKTSYTGNDSFLIVTCQDPGVSSVSITSYKIKNFDTEAKTVILDVDLSIKWGSGGSGQKTVQIDFHICESSTVPVQVTFTVYDSLQYLVTVKDLYSPVDPSYIIEKLEWIH